MIRYDTALICKAGHVINSSAERNPGGNAAFCTGCGEPVIGKCENCNAPIHGEKYEEDDLPLDLGGPDNLGFHDVPAHCHACGKPYPWTLRNAEALKEILDELDGLSDEEREKLKKSIPDIIADTPNSKTAASRFKKAIVKVGQAGRKMLLEVLTRVATEAVKEFIGI
jgi:hypothetical protein